MSDTKQPRAIAERRDLVGIITMNNAARLNCLGTEMDFEIMDAMAAFVKEGCRVIILRAAPGARVWSAGHDIRELPTDGTDPLGWGAPFIQLLRAVRTCPVPMIGAVEGSVWGGACDLAFAMDMLVGTPSTTFAMTPAKIGLPYHVTGLNDFLGVLPLHIVKEMLFTAKPLNAERAHHFGLLNRLVPPEQLETSAMALARDVAALAPKAIRVLKQELRRLAAGPAFTPEQHENIQSLRQAALHSEDYQEGIRAFFEKRPPVFKGR